MKGNTALALVHDTSRTPDEWADIIKADLGRSIEGIIAGGQHLIEAKAALEHGEWIPMLESVGIAYKTASKFMRLARHPVIGNVSSTRLLPNGWTVLDALAQLEPNVLESEIAIGTVHPGLTQNEARDLVRRHNPPRQSTKVESDDRPGATSYSKGIQKISASIVADNCESLTDEQIAEALGAAQFLYELLRGEKIIRERKRK